MTSPLDMLDEYIDDFDFEDEDYEEPTIPVITMGESAHPLISQIQVDPNRDNLIATTYVGKRASLGYMGQWSFRFSSPALQKENLAFRLGLPTAYGFESGNEAFLLEGEGWIALGTYSIGQLNLQFAANDSVVVTDIKKQLDALMTPWPTPEPAPSTVAIQFWYHTNNPMAGATSFSDRLLVPAWMGDDSVRPNYPKATREDLDRLFALQSKDIPGAAGKMILWHGPPGTGKTFAVRSLAWEWRNWCHIMYVVDPEKFLSDGAYLMEVLNYSRNYNWSLIVLEDAGELLQQDARSIVGQGLSRMFNVTDGLLGQSHNVMVLVTTNEAVESMHPAIRRPGRAMFNLEFPAFPNKEAEQWLVERGTVPNFAITEPMTLAEMYAASHPEGRILTTEQKPWG